MMPQDVKASILSVLDALEHISVFDSLFSLYLDQLDRLPDGVDPALYWLIENMKVDLECHLSTALVNMKRIRSHFYSESGHDEQNGCSLSLDPSQLSLESIQHDT